MTATVVQGPMGRDECFRWTASAHGQCQVDSEHRVVSYIGALARKFAKVTPSEQTIADATGLGLRTVNRAIANLTARGLWRKITDPPRRRADGTWYRKRTNWYVLTWAFRHKTPGGTDTPPVAPLCHSEAVRTGRLWKARPRRARQVREKPPAVAPTPVLFEPDDVPAGPPPWIAAGITRAAWLDTLR